MGFKADAAECRRLVSEALNAPYAWVRQRVVRPDYMHKCVANNKFKEEGNATPSMVADAITRHRLDNNLSDPEFVQAVKDTAGTLYAGDRDLF